MRFFSILVLALVAVLAAATLLSEGVMPEGTAVATRVDGTAFLFPGGGAAGRPLMVNEGVAKDDRVEVPGNARVELRLPDGGCLRLSENTRLTVQKLKFERHSGTLHLQAFLHIGRAWVKIRRSAVPDSWAEVVTDAARAGGRDASFGVDSENASATITVYEGAVRVMSAAAAAGQTGPPAEVVRQAGLQALQQAAVPAKEGVRPRPFDLKAGINDWIRWNLQRDARDGLASITIAPASPTVARGASVQLSAVAHYPGNSEKDISLFATWSTSAANIATVGPFGKAAGAQYGTAAIAAAIEDMSGSAPLTVSRSIVSLSAAPAARSIANGAVQQFKATARFSDGSVKDITTSVVWSSSDPAIAVIDATGRAVGGNVPGTAVITAAAGDRKARVRLTVRRELVSLTILPENATIYPGDMQRFGAVGNYSDKTTRDLTEDADWDSSDINVAVVEQVQPGRVQGHAAGTATISATYMGVTGSATVTVEPLTTN